LQAGGDRGAWRQAQHKSVGVTLGCLTLGDQLLGDLGLALQPRQARLLVHARYLLAGGQPLAHDGDYSPVGPLTALASAFHWARWRMPSDYARSPLSRENAAV
jgi:hypothetical protein